MVDIRKIRFFVAVYEAGTITREELSVIRTAVGPDRVSAVWLGHQVNEESSFDLVLSEDQKEWQRGVRKEEYRRVKEERNRRCRMWILLPPPLLLRHLQRSLRLSVNH